MKKTIKILLAILIVFSLFGCGKKPDISGEYRLVKIDAGDSSATEEDIKSLQDLGMEVTLSVSKDGTAKLDVFGEVVDLTYDLEKMTLSDGTNTYTFEYDKSQFRLTDASGTMYFVPVE
jgi:hypothetical protein